MSHTLFDVLGVLALVWLVIENLRLRYRVEEGRYLASIQIEETKRNRGDA